MLPIRRRISVVIVILSLVAAHVCAQPPRTPVEQYHLDRKIQLDRNTGKLRAVLKLDRAEYLPGEVALLTITVTNPTAVSLEVFDPFYVLTGSIEMSIKKTVGQKTEWQTTAPDPLCCVGILRADTLPTRVFAAGEILERQFASHEPHFGADFVRRVQVTSQIPESPHQAAIPLIRMPEYAGEFELTYTYCPTQAVQFRVVPAIAESVAYARLEKQDPPLRYGNGEHVRLVPLPRDVILAVLSAGGTHYIVASRFGQTGDRQIYRVPHTELSVGGARTLGPYVRVGSSNLPITALHGVADSKEQITLTWTIADGRTFTVKLDPDRNVVK